MCLLQRIRKRISILILDALETPYFQQGRADEGSNALLPAKGVSSVICLTIRPIRQYFYIKFVLFFPLFPMLPMVSVGKWYIFSLKKQNIYIVEVFYKL